MFVAMATTASAQCAGAKMNDNSMAMEGKTIVDVAMSDSRFSILVSLLQEANLVDTLKSAGPFTVFAPTNDAFAKIPAATLEQLKSNPEMLRSVLLYHVLGMKVPASAVRTMKAKTVQGSEAQVTVKKGKVMVDNATVIQADVMASNGVIHAIDTVLMPKMNNMTMNKKRTMK